MSIKANHIIGLKLICLSDGRELGKVQDLIYDPDQRRIVALMVDKGGWFSEPKIILINNIRSFGDQAVIIDSPDLIKNSSQVDPRIASIAKNETYITHTKIITDQGTELGTINDLIFDPSSGLVEQFEISQGNLKDIRTGKKYINVSNIETIGKDIIIVNSETSIQKETPVLQKQVDQGVSQIKNTINDVKDEIKDQNLDNKMSNRTEETKQDLNQFVDQVKSGVQDLTESAKEKISETGQNIKTYNKENSVGRYLMINLLDKNDNFIAKRGDLVTHKLIEEAEANGLLTLVLNNVSDKPIES